MEQKPVRGTEPLEPPSVDVARLYLEEAEAVQRRRDERVDRYASAWQAILSGFAIAVIFTVMLLVSRAGAANTQQLIFLIIVTGQIIAGFAERTGVQSRLDGSTRWAVVVLVVWGVAVVALFMFALIDGQNRPLWLSFAPGVAIVVGFGGYGAVALYRDRGHPRPPAVPREPLPVQTRAATAGLGILMGMAALSVGIDDALLASTLSVVLMMVMLAWFFLWKTDAGPQALGRFWRWPQIAAYLLSVALVAWLALLRAYTEAVTAPLSLGVAAIAAVALGVAASLGASASPARESEGVVRRTDG